MGGWFEYDGTYDEPEPEDSVDDWVGSRRGVWRNAAGEVVALRDMSIDYLLRVKALIERTEADYEHGRVYRSIVRMIKKKEKDAKKVHGGRA